MDIVFKCTNCQQELAVDAAGAGTEIECPTCSEILLVPDATPENMADNTPAPASAPPAQTAPPSRPVPTVVSASKVEKHFAVPQHKESQALIKKPKPTLEVAAKDTDKLIRIKTIRHSECQEVGKDRFDETVTNFVQKIGEESIISIHTISHSHFDVNIRQVMSDFGVIIVFRG